MKNIARQSPTEILRIKHAVRERDGFCCTICGISNDQHIEQHGRQLDVHRKTPGSLYSLDGCVTLCRSCHGPQPRRKKGEPDLAIPPRKGFAIFAWINAELGEAFKAYLSSLRPRPTATSAIELALERFLQEQGFWPYRPSSS